MKIVCKCGNDVFHKTVKDFIMCTECRSLTDMSTGQPVGDVYIGQSKPMDDELIDRG